jgi:hypothetical protein
VPRLIEPVVDGAIRALTRAVDVHRVARARNAAIVLARSSYDIQLRYRPVTEVDLARLDLWAAQLIVDEAAGDIDAIGADGFALDYVRDRIRHALDDETLFRVNTELGAIQNAIVDETPAVAARAALRLRETIAQLGITS